MGWEPEYKEPDEANLHRNCKPTELVVLEIGSIFADIEF